VRLERSTSLDKLLKFRCVERDLPIKKLWPNVAKQRTAKIVRRNPIPRWRLYSHQIRKHFGHLYVLCDVVEQCVPRDQSGSTIVVFRK